MSYTALASVYDKINGEAYKPYAEMLCEYFALADIPVREDEVMRRDSIYNRVYKGYSPGMPVIDKYPHKAPAAIWNAMVNPILGYTVKGNIWYQAESNAWRAEDYAPIFVDLVEDWRSLWGQERLPFYFMQVAPYGELPGAVRLEQAKVWEKKLLKDIGMATAIDVGDSLDIHPKNKVVPAHRFALWALAGEYGKKVWILSRRAALGSPTRAKDFARVRTTCARFLRKIPRLQPKSRPRFARSSQRVIL